MIAMLFGFVTEKSEKERKMRMDEEPMAEKKEQFAKAGANLQESFFTG